jgi:hypothetical protein
MKMQAQKQNDELSKVVTHQKRGLVLDRIMSVALALAVVIGYGTIESAARTAMTQPIDTAIALVNAQLETARLNADKPV